MSEGRKSGSKWRENRDEGIWLLSKGSVMKFVWKALKDSKSKEELIKINISITA